MSTCISSQGEYSSHETGERFTCVRCFVFDEDAAVEALEAAERERDTQKRRADDAWETLESNWWRNHYDELAKLHEVATERTVQLAAVIEQAPHGQDCVWWRMAVTAKCTCWKSKVDTGAELREWLASKFESADHYEAMPHKAAGDLVAVLREARS